MTGLVVVSHSTKAAEGIVEIAAEMGGERARIEPAGGDPEGGIGTTVEKIASAIERAADGDGVVVCCDLGSAVMNAEMAIETATIDEEIVIADGPILEGVLNAAVEATSPQATVESVVAAVEAAREH
ncbi:dihydroxyacetone kinase phosphoryl donor subunit DhaM [Halococcus saccharolyticus]|uniref:phosphoenolpyruvate--glycerone phosphotransferase n=1 Tax=Halococcus saccharolyticus DSM 5350 TaxID=1227455 RepID=M0MJQ2_9EURY|nr:dihydroxyacetone kinase phosphoryl donor subunit DhaM [Halococcus saccharolyticus]EMA44675.1 dihydroxyacetone kinase phosphotransfer subunit [Halococcus saccharolyticus DSM 5350]